MAIHGFADSTVALCLRAFRIGSVIVFIETRADSEDVPIGVAHVHLAQVPRHVSRRPGNFDSLLKQ